MRDLDHLLQALRRSARLATGVCIASIAIAVASLVFAFTTAGNARELELRMPVLVVPGAVGGIYSPGITEENIRATARYLANLATNFSGSKGFRERFDEIETFSSAQFLPVLQHARTGLQRDVETQGQSRAFFASPASETLRQIEPGRFEYGITGERLIYSGGLEMENRQSEVRLRLRWGAPSLRNRAGIVLDGFEVKDLATATTGNHAATISRTGEVP